MQINFRNNFHNRDLTLDVDASGELTAVQIDALRARSILHAPGDECRCGGPVGKEADGSLWVLDGTVTGYIARCSWAPGA